ncbi:MAG: isoprenylcysteine carboxylmethyltransferase family protein, partial [Actinomycetota bacterium]
GVGIGLGVAGIVTFSRVGTTVDPHRIENASILVTEGIYRFTRNPMYLGLVLVCAGWGIRLGSVVGTVVGSALLFGVLRQFQIIPEERMMTERFGETYERYRASVRRWI